MAFLWQKHWILVGDSIQAWVVDDPETNPSNPNNLTAVRIASVYNAATIQNLSVPSGKMAGAGHTGVGNYPDDVTNRFGVNSATGVSISGIMITLGTNDLTTDLPLTEFKAVYQAYIAAIRAKTSAPIVLVSPINRYDRTTFPLGKTMAQIRAAVAQVAAAAGAGVTCIDGGGFAPPPGTWHYDGLHLNNGGHYLFAEWIYNEMHARGFW